LDTVFDPLPFIQRQRAFQAALSRSDAVLASFLSLGFYYSDDSHPDTAIRPILRPDFFDQRRLQRISPDVRIFRERMSPAQLEVSEYEVREWGGGSYLVLAYPRDTLAWLTSWDSTRAGWKVQSVRLNLSVESLEWLEDAVRFNSENAARRRAASR
jgi:hypothetical protein